MGRRQKGRQPELVPFIAVIAVFIVFVFRQHLKTIVVWTILALVLAGIAALFKVRKRRAQSDDVMPARSTRPRSEPQNTPYARLANSTENLIGPATLNDWSLDLIRSVEWKRFEELCDNYFKTKGWTTKPANFGPDGGVDIFLYGRDASKPLGIVQCKAWGSAVVSVKEIRELFGIMTDIGSTLGIFITTSAYSEDAKRFASDKHIKLMDADHLLELIRALPEEQRQALLTTTTAGDYRTPSCPTCGVKLVWRVAQKGRHAGQPFWGCKNYPRCKYTMRVRTA